jgi:hypothetical protein
VPCVVCVAHLLGLQVYVGSFETSQQGEMVCCFLKRHFLGLVGLREAFHGLRVQDITELNSG